MLRPPNLTSKATSNANEFSGEPSVCVYVCVFVCVAVCLCNVRKDACWHYQSSQPVQAFSLSPYTSVPPPLYPFPSPYKLCHLSFLWSCTGTGRQRERYVGPQLASNMKHVRYNVRCATRCVVWLRCWKNVSRPRRQTWQAGSMQFRSGLLNRWWCAGGEGGWQQKKEKKGAWIGGWVRLSKRALSNLHCMSLARCLEGERSAGSGSCQYPAIDCQVRLLRTLANPIPPPHTHMHCGVLRIYLVTCAAATWWKATRAMTRIICPCMSLHVCACLSVCTYVCIRNDWCFDLGPCSLAVVLSLSLFLFSFFFWLPPAAVSISRAAPLTATSTLASYLAV